MRTNNTDGIKKLVLSQMWQHNQDENIASALLVKNMLVVGMEMLNYPEKFTLADVPHRAAASQMMKVAIDHLSKCIDEEK